MHTLETCIRDGLWKLPRALLRFRGAGGVVLVTLLSSACVSPLVQNAPAAMQAATSRARFELNCPEVQATVLSQKIIQGFRFEGSEYTIGVRGCDRQAIYVTYCGEMENCNALSQTGRVQPAPGLGPGGPGFAPPGSDYPPPGGYPAPGSGYPPPGSNLPPPGMAP